MAEGILIDERGRRWPDRSWDLVRRLGRFDPGLELSTFAVRERGFIHIRPQENGARVALCAGRFGLETLAGALYELKERRFPRILLAMLVEEEWFYEMLGSAWEFAERAEQLLAGGGVMERHPWLAAERDLAALDLPVFSSLRPIVELWRAHRGRLPAESGAFIVNAGLLDRMILVRRRRPNLSFVFAHFGAGIECRPAGESEHLVDREIHDHHDRDYGAWVAAAYAEAASLGRPHLRSIRATIRVSDTTVARGRYDRLILPWQSARGEDFAMGISLTRDHRCLDARRQIGK
ncbi:MAG TPA: hypothetical protein VMA53_02370 [Stellaceae bacterium]|nr:hypothetical protein [Stellaceae bacterium]